MVWGATQSEGQRKFVALQFICAKCKKRPQVVELLTIGAKQLEVRVMCHHQLETFHVDTTTPKTAPVIAFGVRRWIS